VIGLLAGHHVLIVVPGDAFHVLGHGPPGHGHAIAVQIAMLEHGLHQQRNAANLEHVLGDIFAARFQVGDVGRAS
jgi:hypothetical protein